MSTNVQIEILFCGICHSDLHSVRNEWSEFMPTVYPIVPGHEIVGRVTTVGPAVTKYKPGDLAAVGCLVDSDRTCPRCKAGLENFCPNLTFTFNSPNKHLGSVTYGGYWAGIVLDERFVLPVPSNPRPRRGGGAPLRRNADIFAHARLGRDQRYERGHGGSRRSGSHGREVCACARSPRRGLHHFAPQEGRRAPAGC